MRRSTAKLIRQTAKATNAPYRLLKKAFYNLSQKDKHLARLEMKQAFKKQKEKEDAKKLEKTEI